ncbi:MAG: hydrogenase small subunit [Piscinibacter sp.]|uniref:hydrogenase small subunit n=1 Tax=Piscinibacter sp. TaxID=1903157 RepID=UPI0025844731|nr:hydrogenase small subunit [Piscinibacter sp.]MCW5665899.1 hydrogenase small subunit [Piscinibacter sp.]
MAETRVLGELLRERGVSRRALLKYAGWIGSLMALPPGLAPAMAEGLAQARRQAVIWLSFQECTGCTESLTRSFSPTLEELIFDFISLDYHHTLQAASGEAAEAARRRSMQENAGKYIVVVDGSVPVADGGVYSVIAGQSNLDMLAETVSQAAAVVAVGTCAAFGGLPEARPNPTGAVSIAQLVKDKPVVNIPGCPPLPQAMAGTLVHLLSFGRLPELDALGRPRAFFGETIHDRCYRRPFYERGLFAHRFDDEGARQGWCLYELGCKGPVTYNACASLKWNGGVSFPIQSGHGCIGCSEPRFWDRGGLYRPLSTGTADTRKVIGIAAAAGVALGAGSALLARRRQAEHAQQATAEKKET